jgi:hypothetical protein
MAQNYFIAHIPFFYIHVPQNRAPFQRYPLNELLIPPCKHPTFKGGNMVENLTPGTNE